MHSRPDQLRVNAGTGQNQPRRDTPGTSPHAWGFGRENVNLPYVPVSNRAGRADERAASCRSTKHCETGGAARVNRRGEMLLAGIESAQMICMLGFRFVQLAHIRVVASGTSLDGSVWGLNRAPCCLRGVCAYVERVRAHSAARCPLPCAIRSPHLETWLLHQRRLAAQPIRRGLRDEGPSTPTTRSWSRAAAASTSTACRSTRTRCWSTRKFPRSARPVVSGGRARRSVMRRLEGTAPVPPAPRQAGQALDGAALHRRCGEQPVPQGDCTGYPWRGCSPLWRPAI